MINILIANPLQPVDQCRQIGRIAYFACKSDENVSWKFNRNKLPSNARSGIHGGLYVLNITNLQSDNAGMYTCFGTNNGNDFKADGFLNVISKYIVS